jgi:GNAT superfamily N-acetyltransferase
VLVRPATHDDVAEIARVHVESAEAAYGSLAPASDAELARRVANWTAMLDDPSRSPFVAESAGRIVGVLSIGPASAEVGVGELHVLYVHPDWWGRGAGQQLIDRAHRELARSFSTAVLTVIASNPRARRFYERNDWRLDTVVIEKHFGHPIEVARYTRTLER